MTILRWKSNMQVEISKIISKIDAKMRRHGATYGC